MSVSQALVAVLRRWWIVLLLLIVGGGAAGIWTATAPRVYESSVSFFVSTPSTNDAAALAADQFASRRVNSYVRLLSSGAVGQIVHDAGVDLSAAAIANKIHGSADLNTVLLTATVDDTSQARALQIATIIGSKFGDVVAEVDAQAAPAKLGSADPVQLKVVSGPSVSSRPISPQKALNLAVGLLVGFLIGVGIAIGREVSDKTVRTVAQLSAITRVPVLGAWPRDRWDGAGALSVRSGVSSGRQEAFRKIRTNVQFMNSTSPVELRTRRSRSSMVLTISSSAPGEGKTSTALELGIVTADAGSSVLIIDCNLRNPQVGARTGTSNAVGLVDVLAAGVNVEDAIQHWSDGGLDVLPAGTAASNPSELLNSALMTRLVTHLRSRYDLILLDTPALAPVTDAAVTLAYSDAMILVVRYRKTSQAEIVQALDAMKSVDGHVLGAVLALIPQRGSGSEGGDVTGMVTERPWWRPFGKAEAR